MIRFLTIASAFSIVANVLSAPALAQGARFELSLAWTEPEVDDEPIDRVQTIYLTLGAGGKVTEEIRERYPGRGRQGLQQSGALGEDVAGQRKGRWKVVNERTLVRLNAQSTHTFAIWVTTEPGGACSVRMEWRLKPGFTTYERWASRRQDTVKFGQPTVQHASCRAY